MTYPILTFWSAVLILIVLQHETEAQRSSNVWTSGLDISYDSYENWSEQINNTQPFLIVYPRSSQQVASIVTWAYTVGRNVRVQGYRHSYPPITVSKGDDPAKTVIIDMTRHMKSLRMASVTVPNRIFLSASKLNTVVAQPGASMDELMTFAENNGFGIVMSPIIGQDATVGGVLAIGGHGAAIPALNEKLTGLGYSFGSVSNFIVELKAVVWDERSHSYQIKTFTRNNPDISAFLVHIGRAIITEVTLMVGKNYKMQCVSRLDVPINELFAHPDNSSGSRTMTRYMDEVGRVDVIWLPFTESPWLKLWKVSETRPPSSRLVTGPYNYQFTYAQQNPQVPGTVFGPQGMERLARGLTQQRSWDIWGPSKNTLLQYNRTATPLVYSGFVVLTNRANMQLVLHDIAKFYQSLLSEYERIGIFPIDQYVKIRVSGLDNPSDTLIPGAIAADISPTSPMHSRPDFNVGVWMNTLTTTRRPYSDEFMRRFEEFAYARFNGLDGLARPEWAKNWAHSNIAPFELQTFIHETIPRVFGVEKWNHAIEVLDKHDPHQVITNRFLRELMVPYHGPTSLPTPVGISDHHLGNIVNGFGWGDNLNIEPSQTPFL